MPIFKCSIKSIFGHAKIQIFITQVFGFLLLVFNLNWKRYMGNLALMYVWDLISRLEIFKVSVSVKDYQNLLPILSKYIYANKF